MNLFSRTLSRELLFRFSVLLTFGAKPLPAQVSQPVRASPLAPRLATRSQAMTGVSRGVGTKPGALTDRLPKQAQAVMQQFQEALRRSDWTEALSHCTDKVKKSAAEYPSVEAFFQTVTPFAAISEAQSFPMYMASGWRSADDYESSTGVGLFVEVQRAEKGETAQWKWTMAKTDKGWLIDFNSQPFDRWFDGEIASRNEQVERFKKNQAMLLEKMKGVWTRLTPVSRRYVVGRPMMFRLELVNNGEAELMYDDQQAGVNGSFTIYDETGQCVPYTGGCAQTIGASRPIVPGQTVVLFDNFDISKQYDMRKPGHYKLQYNSHGLEIGAMKDKPNPKVPPFFSIIASTNSFPSNIVEVEIGASPSP